MKNFKYNVRNFFLITGGILMASCNKTPVGNNDKFDYSKYPFYNEDINSVNYKFDDEEISNPFWKGNVIYNETVLLTKNNETGEISGNLMFKPTKIISVKDFTLKTTDYVLNEDYEFNENKLIRKETSKIPFRTTQELSGEVVPEGFVLTTGITNVKTDLVNMGGAVYTESPFYYGSQLSVTYAYDLKDIDDSLDLYPTYNEEKLSHVLTKLKNKESVKLVGLGDSVLEGCSSSKKFDHEPFMDSFIDMVATNLSRLYETNVELKNLSVGGKKSSWGCQSENINAIVQESPDLLFLHFGINDLGDNRAVMAYMDDMLSIVLDIQNKLPNCDIILLSPFGPNRILYDYDKMQEYVDCLASFEEEYDNVKLVDVFKISKEMYKQKSYYDMSANGINHVNDYASRIYLQAILATLYNYSK